VRIIANLSRLHGFFRPQKKDAMVLKLPKRAEAAFLIESGAGPHYRFAFQVHGFGREGMWEASYQGFGRDVDSGVRQLPNGEWQLLQHLIERCGFWSLPEDGTHLAERYVTTEDGERLAISGRDATRYQQLNRYEWWEPGLNGLVAFARRVSGFFVRHPVSGLWVQPELVPLPQNQGAAPAPGTSSADD